MYLLTTEYQNIGRFGALFMGLLFINPRVAIPTIPLKDLAKYNKLNVGTKYTTNAEEVKSGVVAI